MNGEQFHDVLPTGRAEHEDPGDPLLPPEILPAVLLSLFLAPSVLCAEGGEGSQHGRQQPNIRTVAGHTGRSPAGGHDGTRELGPKSDSHRVSGLRLSLGGRPAGSSRGYQNRPRLQVGIGPGKATLDMLPALARSNLRRIPSVSAPPQLPPSPSTARGPTLNFPRASSPPSTRRGPPRSPLPCTPSPGLHQLGRHVARRPPAARHDVGRLWRLPDGGHPPYALWSNGRALDTEASARRRHMDVRNSALSLPRPLPAHR